MTKYLPDSYSVAKSSNSSVRAVPPWKPTGHVQSEPRPRIPRRGHDRGGVVNHVILPTNRPRTSSCHRPRHMNSNLVWIIRLRTLYLLTIHRDLVDYQNMAIGGIPKMQGIYLIYSLRLKNI